MSFSLPERLRARDPRFLAELRSDAHTPDPRAECLRFVSVVAVWCSLGALIWLGVAALAYWAFFGGQLF